MPIISIRLAKGRTIDQKRRLVAKITLIDATYFSSAPLQNTLGRVI